MTHRSTRKHGRPRLFSLILVSILIALVSCTSDLRSNEGIRRLDDAEAIEKMAENGQDDPCLKKASCDECKSTDSKIDGKVCLWSEGSCALSAASDTEQVCDPLVDSPVEPPNPAPVKNDEAVKPVEEKPTAAKEVPADDPELASDKCADASNCKECIDATSGSKDQYCLWEDEKCVKGGDTQMTKEMCEPKVEDENPCAEAKDCDACDRADAGEKGKACLWDGDTCDKERASKKPDDMCAKPDPCAEAKDCEECDIAKADEDDQVCVWDGKTCEKKGADEKPTDMCAKPDPCAKAKDCDECDATKTDEDGKACLWDGKTCEKKGADEKPANMCVKPDPCAKAKDCDGCDATKTDEDGKACVWDGKTCEKKGAEKKPANMCVKPDPCSDAADCDTCDVVDADESDKACVWDGTTCALKDADKKSANMCVKPDPCAKANICGECDVLDAEETGKNCVWDGKTCEMKDGDKKPADMCLTPDPCAKASICEECDVMDAESGKACVWDGTMCEKKSVDKKSDKMCVKPDPCTKATDCEDCDDTNAGEAGKACVWDGKYCEKKGADKKSDDMCAQPDPCTEATSCDECDVVDADESGKACVWDGKSCEKKSAAKKSDNMCDKPDLCKSLTSCDSCKQADPEEAGKACIWDRGMCVKGIEADKPDDMCVEIDESGGFGFMPVLSLLLFIAMAGYCYYQKRARVGMSHIGDLSNKRFHKTAVYEGVSTNEADSDADDWDWDEGGGDVELAQDTHISHLVSSETSFGKPRSKTPPSQKKRLIQRSSSKDKQDKAPTPQGASRPGMNLHNAAHPPSSSRQVGAVPPTNLHHRNNHLDQPHETHTPSPASAPMITKLGIPKPTATKLPVAATPKADDFFAEFDLAAKPTFGKAAPSRPATTIKAQPSAPIQLTPDANEFDDDWGDDDLDDLLDD